MDDGISGIILIISIFIISLVVYLSLADEGLFPLILIISIVTMTLLVYTSFSVATTKWDRNKIKKQWDCFEEMEKIETPNINNELSGLKNNDS